MLTEMSVSGPLKDVPRSRIYKGRPIILKMQVPTADINNLIKQGYPRSSLPNGAADGKFTTLSQIFLTEVTSIKVQSGGGVGQARGVVTAILQMWYLDPTTITISGRSYMGAFQPTTIPFINVQVGGEAVGADNDVDMLLSFKSSIGSYFFQKGFPRDMRFKLEYGTPGQGRQSYQSFIGYLDDISVDESEDKPYMRDYSIKFVGTEEDQQNIISGAIAYKNAHALLDKLKIKGADRPLPRVTRGGGDQVPLQAGSNAPITPGPA